MKTSEMQASKFLKKDDVGRGIIGTIASCVQYDVSMEDKPTELKWCLTFEELDKPLVLNSTNIQLCEQICGSDDTDDWRGKRIVLYTDPNVSYGGKLVGGIRVRAVRVKPAAVAPVPVKAKPKPAPVVEDEEFGDELEPGSDVDL